MTLKKLTQDHYIIIDDSEIKEGDWLYSFDNGLIVQANRGSADTINSKSLNGRGYAKITHSTRPESLGMGWMQSVLPLLLSEVKELIGEVDVEKKAYEYAINDFDDYAFCGYVKGYNQALEDNKEKKYTEEDLRKAYYYGKSMMTPQNFEKFIKSLQPKTEWDVEFVDGKLKLK